MIFDNFTLLVIAFFISLRIYQIIDFEVLKKIVKSFNRKITLIEYFASYGYRIEKYLFSPFERKEGMDKIEKTKKYLKDNEKKERPLNLEDLETKKERECIILLEKIDELDIKLKIEKRLINNLTFLCFFVVISLLPIIFMLKITFILFLLTLIVFLIDNIRYYFDFEEIKKENKEIKLLEKINFFKLLLLPNSLCLSVIEEIICLGVIRKFNNIEREKQLFKQKTVQIVTPTQK